MNKLEKLLYRKASTEKLMMIWSKGIKMYTDYLKSCQSIDNGEGYTELQRTEARKNIHEAEIPLKHYITSFKFAQREYDNHILPEIEKLTTEEERKGIEFMDVMKKYDELAEIEIFSNHSTKPANVELIEVNKSIETHIKLLEDLIKVSTDKLSTSKDEHEKAKLNLDIFKYNLHLVSNKKRLQERVDYYKNQFLPKYEKDMVEADKYLDIMLQRASDIVKSGIDIPLGFMLTEYEKHKEEKEKVWLFYTALKSRLKKISKEMHRNKGKFKGKMHLAEGIVK